LSGDQQCYVGCACLGDAGALPQHHGLHEQQSGNRNAKSLVEIPIAARHAEGCKSNALHRINHRLRMRAGNWRPGHPGRMSGSIHSGQDGGDAQPGPRAHR
jgi:hypothetical protein